MPTRKDAERTAAALAEPKIKCFVCANIAELCGEMERGAGAAILTEEAIDADKTDCLGKVLQQEPAWSNFPLIVLAQERRGARRLPASKMLNTTLVEKPVRIATLRSVVAASLRHRRHQYEVHDMLQELTRAREALAESNQELEHKVHERTEKLQETVRELEAFSYSISHDLRSPLRSMEGYAQAVLDDYGDRLDENGRRMLRRIASSAARLDLLVQDVLAYSRVAKGEVRLEKVSVGKIVREVIETYPKLREQARITVEEPMPEVRAHPGYLMQCVSNLLGNGVKFSQPGVEPEIRIWAEDERDGERSRVWFEDNGIGIAPEHFKEIFEIFGRVHSSQHYEGTGIGLAIVRKAVERMGGSTGVNSEIGKGAKFWLSLQKSA
ncbi:MAG TPA: ATP-binding protein [Verrucomicrobiae bacterium]|nr:ATP-binding protein [Verrucomicrobiae bacterium]